MIKINTELIGKKEVFDTLAVAYHAQIPILLYGKPGVAKSQVVKDFANSLKLKTFETQLSFGSRPSEIKGILNIPKLMQGVQETICPIADAEVIIIDEVDKGSSEIRNTLLSIMRERELYLGAESSKKCVWKLFVGTCNEIPEDEVNNPFWDRFILKFHTNALDPKMYPKLWENNFTSYEYEFEDKPIDSKYTKEIIKLLAKIPQIKSSRELTDRTIKNLYSINKAIMNTLNLNFIESLIKTAVLIHTEEAYNEIINEIADPKYIILSSTMKNIMALNEYSSVTAKHLITIFVDEYAKTKNILIKELFEKFHDEIFTFYTSKENEKIIEEFKQLF